MSNPRSKYAEAGVDIDTGNAIVRDIKAAVRATFSPHVLTDIGLFGGLFDLHGLPYRHPVLVSSIDGVGTKLHIAAALRRFRGVGHDIVAHCCNDIAVQGARPLFFLDYVAAAKLSQEAVVEIVQGMAEECRANGCALIGGETAEMPGTYTEGQFDVVGCIVGVVERDAIIDGHAITVGDCVIGLASSGLHTNGYSLARKVLLNDAKLALTAVPAGCDRPLGDILLEPHRSYAPFILTLMAHVPLHGLAHITGGGLLENIPRILPQNIDVIIDTATLRVPPIFTLIQRLGDVSREEMFRVFNMGIGLVIIVAPAHVHDVLEAACAAGFPATVIGHTCPGQQMVRLQ
ncbi:MAG: phosphoribosylformylglycinamidine cyclo-ligase [bacterium]|nr:phosphoribosylformylglycinamidine cyclo-ligase [bacterium]